MCYVIFLIVWQCKTNIAETTVHCGSPQWSNIILWTIIPNIVFFGYSKKEVLGKWFGEFFTP